MPRSATNSTASASTASATRQRRNKKTPARQSASVYVADAGLMDWETTGKDGLSLKTVRDDQANGLFLGAVGFEPLVRSGLHQHQGVATSFFARGGITDYSGSSAPNDVGINLKGATHDAIAYDTSMLISRLEGPVTYPENSGQLHHLHSGAHHGQIINERPFDPPNIYVPTATAPIFDTGVVGVNRQMMFDYSGVGDNHRMVLWSMRPDTVVASFKTTAVLEMWVQAGDLAINDSAAHANCFVIIEPDQHISLVSQFGARVFVWTEGPALAQDLPDPDRLFGY